VPDTLGSDSIGDGPRIVMVHGFAQNSACWGPLHPALTVDHQVVAVDAPGHGRSSEVSTDLWGAGDLLVDVGGAATYLGYSMGSRMCLHAALAHPGAVERLVLIGATAGIDGKPARRERLRSDEALARRIEQEGVVAFVKGWLDNPLFAGLPQVYRFEHERHSNSAAGLADSLRRCGTGTQESLWPRLGELDMPVLAIAGAEDARYAGFAQRIADAVGPNARSALVPGAGHSPHLERPDETIAIIRDWLT
jgi:2-succinyl-6-hydroxy-2,4-cyclohexadiene-1-carboxylate synthase